MQLLVQRLEPLARALVIPGPTPAATVAPTPSTSNRAPDEREDQEEEEEREQEPESSEEERVVVESRSDRRPGRGKPLGNPQLIRADAHDRRDHERHDDPDASHVNLLCDVVERKRLSR